MEFPSKAACVAKAEAGLVVFSPPIISRRAGTEVETWSLDANRVSAVWDSFWVTEVEDRVEARGFKDTSHSLDPGGSTTRFWFPDSS